MGWLRVLTQKFLVVCCSRCLERYEWSTVITHASFIAGNPCNCSRRYRPVGFLCSLAELLLFDQRCEDVRVGLSQGPLLTTVWERPPFLDERPRSLMVHNIWKFF